MCCISHRIEFLAGVKKLLKQLSDHGTLKYFIEARPITTSKTILILSAYTALSNSALLTTRREKNTQRNLTSFCFSLVFALSVLICSAPIVTLIMQYLSGLLSRQQQTYRTLIALATGQPAQINLAR